MSTFLWYASLYWIASIVLITAFLVVVEGKRSWTGFDIVMTVALSWIILPFGGFELAIEHTIPALKNMWRRASAWLSEVMDRTFIDFGPDKT